jgi:hypothetical protein
MRPRVVHRLPGRLRIHIPALKNVSPDFHEIATALLRDFHFPKGVDDASVNYVTGNILVEYNRDYMPEAEILKWIIDIKNIVAVIFMKFISMHNGEMEKARIKLTHYLKTASQNGTVIDKTFKIPHDVWN